MIETLMQKFVNPLPRAPHEPKQADQVAIAIATYVKNRVPRELHFHAEATPETILGRKVSRIGPVALTLKSDAGWTLIDGVDLNVLKPQKAIERADDVGRIFWQYSRLENTAQIGRIRKIGVVLNGISHLKETEHDAHDYALHRLELDADAAIDAASTEAGAKLERELQTLG